MGIDIKNLRHVIMSDPEILAFGVEEKLKPVVVYLEVGATGLKLCMILWAHLYQPRS